LREKTFVGSQSALTAASRDIVAPGNIFAAKAESVVVEKLP